MYKLALIAALCAGAAACSPTATGTVAGATTGAIVGGPVGAVVGAGVGAAAGATTQAAAGPQMASGPAPGLCYVTDGMGNIAVDPQGRAIARRC